MTLDLNAIKARVEAATPGPWEVFGRDRHIIGNDYTEAQRSGTVHSQWTHNTTPANAAFIAHARQDIPALLQEIERLTAERDELKALDLDSDTYWAEERDALRTALSRLTADHAALRTVVREWVEAKQDRAAQDLLDPKGPEAYQRILKAEAALAALGGGNG